MEHLVTPYFRHQSIENVPQSEIQGLPVMEIKEVVELRFAGDKNYSPVFLADQMYRREGHRVITYAERFAEQYRAFSEGKDQEASGTPLEMLVNYGITEAQLSLCRVAKVYSIEALHALEKPGLNTLGQSANPLKEMARHFMEDRNSGNDAAREIAKLREELAALRSVQPIPAADPTSEDIAAAVAIADSEFDSMSEADLRSFIKDKTGQAPGPRAGRDFLVNAAKELAA